MRSLAISLILINGSLLMLALLSVVLRARPPAGTPSSSTGRPGRCGPSPLREGHVRKGGRNPPPESFERPPPPPALRPAGSQRGV